MRIVCLLTTLLLMPISVSAQKVPYQEGQAFPLIPLPRLADGELTTLEAFQGRKLVLHIWASW